MNDDKVVLLESQSHVADLLTALLREKASALLQAAIEAECAELLAHYEQVRDLNGCKAIVRNGYLPERSVLTGLGPIAAKVPRVRDRTGQGVRFESKLVPHYVRRAASVDAVLPWLYLRGISQADVGPALEALVGPEAGNLSAGVIGRLKQTWAAEYARWSKSDLSKERWVYGWADGVYSGVRAEDTSVVCAGGRWRQRARPEALPGDRGRRAGIEAELARSAVGTEAAWPASAQGSSR